MIGAKRLENGSEIYLSLDSWHFAVAATVEGGRGKITDQLVSCSTYLRKM